jgi:hypothetical protein
MPPKGVIEHRQVADAYLVLLARIHGGSVATMDEALAAHHEGVTLIAARWSSGMTALIWFYVLKIGSVRWRGKCPRHPRFDPYMDGPGAIRGACEKCTLLLEIHARHKEMVAMMRRFAPPPSPRRRAEATADLQQNLFGEL